MNNIYKNVRFGGTALVVLLATSFATAYGQGNGNNQPSGQAGGTGTSNVVVTNSPAQPVPTKDQNNPAYQPFQWQGPVLAGVGLEYGTAIFNVPAGKRLVVEQISALVRITSGVSGQIPQLDLNTIASNVQANTFVPMFFAGNSTPLSVSFIAAQPIRMYGDPGSQIVVEVKRSLDINGTWTGNLIANVTLTGYLVNIP